MLTTLQSRDFFDRIAPSYGKLWTIEDENRIAARQLLGDDCTAIEIGCGNGRFMMNAPSQVIGVDFSIEMLRLVKVAMPDAKVVMAEASRLPFRCGVTSTIVIVNALHNNANPDEWLREAQRVSSHRLIVDYRNMINPVMIFRAIQYRRLFRRVSLEYTPYWGPWFFRLLRRCGWKVVRRLSTRRPLADPTEGFRWRHVVGYLVSLIPGLAPTYVVEAVRSM